MSTPDWMNSWPNMIFVAAIQQRTNGEWAPLAAALVGEFMDCNNDNKNKIQRYVPKMASFKRIKADAMSSVASSASVRALASALAQQSQQGSRDFYFCPFSPRPLPLPLSPAGCAGPLYVERSLARIFNLNLLILACAFSYRATERTRFYIIYPLFKLSPHSLERGANGSERESGKESAGNKFIVGRDDKAPPLINFSLKNDTLGVVLEPARLECLQRKPNLEPGVELELHVLHGEPKRCLSSTLFRLNNEIHDSSL